MSDLIKTLIVDDSPTVTEVLKYLLESESDIELIGTAADPFEAIDIMQDIKPDVIILDIEMPKMDGLTFLQKIMSENPIPVVICSSFTDANSEMTARSYEYGAVEVILKPSINPKYFEESKTSLCSAVRNAGNTDLARLLIDTQDTTEIVATQDSAVNAVDRIIVLGASTGGPQALNYLLRDLPTNLPGIVVIQDLPVKFTQAFATRLDHICAVEVKEAVNGEEIKPGCVYISPGAIHTLISKQGNTFHIKLEDGPLVNRQRPSVDVLFKSAAECAGSGAIGVMLTGMGDDGAAGMLQMKQAGAYNIAQSPGSCAAAEMPVAAINADAVNRVIDIGEMSSCLIEILAKK